MLLLVLINKSQVHCFYIQERLPKISREHTPRLLPVKVISALLLNFLMSLSVCLVPSSVTLGGGLPYKDRGANHTGKIVVLVHPGVSILKKSIAGALAVHFWVLSKKMQCEFLCCFRIGTSRGEKKSHPQNRILVPFFKVIPLK